MGTALRRVALLAGAALLIAAGCRSSYYEEYRTLHPGFDPALPRDGATLEEVLAALHSPPAVESIAVELSELRIFRSDTERWTAIPFAAIRDESAGISPQADYVVLVAWSCSFEMGLKTGGSTRWGYYLFPRNRLGAYDHYAFREQCAASNEFRAARGGRTAVELEAMDRISGSGSRYTLPQAYSRGLAYVEAGRLQEARAMLVIGERGYRAAAEQLRGNGRLAALGEVQSLRAGLMRALGVEERR